MQDVAVEIGDTRHKALRCAHRRLQVVTSPRDKELETILDQIADALGAYHLLAQDRRIGAKTEKMESKTQTRIQAQLATIKAASAIVDELQCSGLGIYRDLTNVKHSLGYAEKLLLRIAEFACGNEADNDSS